MLHQSKSDCNSNQTEISSLTRKIKLRSNTSIQINNFFSIIKKGEMNFIAVIVGPDG